MILENSLLQGGRIQSVNKVDAWIPTSLRSYSEYVITYPIFRREGSIWIIAITKDGGYFIGTLLEKDKQIALDWMRENIDGAYELSPEHEIVKYYSKY